MTEPSCKFDDDDETQATALEQLIDYAGNKGISLTKEQIEHLKLCIAYEEQHATITVPSLFIDSSNGDVDFDELDWDVLMDWDWKEAEEDAKGDVEDDDDEGSQMAKTNGVPQKHHVIIGDIRDMPMYRDGISTTGTYLILATKPKDTDHYNCVCQGNDKIKFYPDKEYFGITEEDLTAVGVNLNTKKCHEGYERYMCSRQQAVKLLTTVAATRGTVAVSAQMAESAPRTKYGLTPRRKDDLDFDADLDE